MSKDPRDDLTMGQMRVAAEMWSTLLQNISDHAVVFYADPDHKCPDFDPEIIEDDEFDLSAEQITAYFALEASALESFRFIRLAMRREGMAVQQLAEHVSNDFAAVEAEAD